MVASLSPLEPRFTLVSRCATSVPHLTPHSRLGIPRQARARSGECHEPVGRTRRMTRDMRLGRVADLGCCPRPTAESQRLFAASLMAQWHSRTSSPGPRRTRRLRSSQPDPSPGRQPGRPCSHFTGDARAADRLGNSVRRLRNVGCSCRRSNPAAIRTAAGRSANTRCGPSSRPEAQAKNVRPYL